MKHSGLMTDSMGCKMAYSDKSTDHGGNTYCKCFDINPSLSAESNKMLTYELGHGVVDFELMMLLVWTCCLP